MFRINTINVIFACAVLFIGGCFCAGCNSSSDNGTSASNTPTQHGIIPPPDPRMVEAQHFFVEDFWNKRFTKCSDGWYKARIDTKNYYFKSPINGPQTGWLAVKGEPQDWKMDVGVPTEADQLRGITWYAEITLAPSASIAFVDGTSVRGRWENYHDGWAAMTLAAVSEGGVDTGDQMATQIESEYKQIYLQVFYNKNTTPRWNVEVSPGRYQDVDAIFVRSWLIYGAKPATCTEFPHMP